MFNGRDLLNVENPYDVKYVTNILSILFTKEELKSGIIKTNLSRTTKSELDPIRVKLLKGFEINLN